MEQAKSPMSMLLAMSTCSGGFYVSCILLYAVLSRCRTWRRDWSYLPPNQIEIEERIQEQVAAQIEMQDTGFWPQGATYSDTVRLSILEACEVEVFPAVKNH